MCASGEINACEWVSMHEYYDITTYIYSDMDLSHYLYLKYVYIAKILTHEKSTALCVCKTRHCVLCSKKKNEIQTTAKKIRSRPEYSWPKSMCMWCEQCWACVYVCVYFAMLTSAAVLVQHQALLRNKFEIVIPHSTYLHKVYIFFFLSLLPAPSATIIIISHTLLFMWFIHHYRGHQAQHYVFINVKFYFTRM